MGAKHVADLVRTVLVGIDGRVSRRQEDEFNEDDVVAKANWFLDTLTAAFPDMAGIADGSVTPPQLRGRSLLGSVIFQRVLAGAYHDLVGDHGWNRLQVERFFALLAPHTTAPVNEGSPWLEHTGQFSVGSSAPTARTQALRALTNAIVSWALTTPDWLKAA